MSFGRFEQLGDVLLFAQLAVLESWHQGIVVYLYMSNVPAQGSCS
jgi:hypothetical protein